MPYPRAAVLRDAYLAFCSRLLTEVRINPIFPLSAHPPRGWATLHLATLPLPGGFPLCTGNARAMPRPPFFSQPLIPGPPRI